MRDFTVHEYVHTLLTRQYPPVSTILTNKVNSYKVTFLTWHRLVAVFPRLSDVRPPKANEEAISWSEFHLFSQVGEKDHQGSPGETGQQIMPLL